MNSCVESHSIGQCVNLACLWEVSAPKVGNVNRGADFADMSFYDLVTSAAIIGEVLTNASDRTLGENILLCIEQTRRAVRCNTNLGMVLLLAPLAMVPRQESLRSGVNLILQNLGPEDCRQVYTAIETAKPGGLGTVDSGDVHDETPHDLIRAMELARDRDLIAAQYCNGFDDVFAFVVKSLVELQTGKCGIMDAIVQTQLRLMSEYPDSLIARKCGKDIADQSALMAGKVLEHEPNSPAYLHKLSEFDFWLRADGNRRNPGTTADLITAGLFVMLRDGLVETPFQF